jgi:hypothetical protein
MAQNSTCSYILSILFVDRIIEFGDYFTDTGIRINGSIFNLITLIFSNDTLIFRLMYIVVMILIESTIFHIIEQFKK